MGSGTTGRGRARALLLLVSWIVGCTTAVAAMWSVREPRFDAPPMQPSRWSAWAAGRDLLDVVAGLGRMVASVALIYLIVAALLHVLALASGRRSLRRLSSRLNPAPIAGLAAAVVLGGAPLAGAAQGPQEPRATMVLVEDDPTTTTAPTTTAPTTTLTTTTTTPSTTGPSTTDPSATGPSTTDRESESAPRTGAREAAQLSLVVEPGDHLWGIAERRVRLALGGDPSEAEIRSYWVALISANADRLIREGDAGLIVAGQVLVLPG